MRKRNSTPLEWEEQDNLVKWLSLHPILKDFYCKNHNEGKRSAKDGAFLVRQGLRAGVSDLFIYYPKNQYHGLWLEMKRNKSYTLSARLSESWIAQETFMDIVTSVGFDAHFCFGWEHAVKIIENYLKPHVS
jgi:hypothetical protein